MNLIRQALDDAIAQAIAERPKYFTSKGLEHARAHILRHLLTALRGDAEKPAEAEETTLAPATPQPLKVTPDSREARGYAVLRMAAGATEPHEVGGYIYIPHTAASAAVFALADAPPRDAWLLVDDSQQVGAWSEMFRDTLPTVARREVRRRSLRNLPALLVPYPYPPSKTGKIYEVVDA